MAPKARGRPPAGNAKISKYAPRVPPTGLAEGEDTPRHDHQAGPSSDAIDLDSPPSPEGPSASGRGNPVSAAADPHGDADSPSKRSRTRGEYLREISMAMDSGEGGGEPDTPEDVPLESVDGGITKDMIEEDAQARSIDSGPPLPAGHLQSYGKPVDSDGDITGDDDITGDEMITTPPVSTDVSPTQPFFQSQAFAETAKQSVEEGASGAGPAAAPAASDGGLKTPDPVGEVMDRMSTNRGMVVDQIRNFEDRLTHVEKRYCSSIKIQDEKSNLYQKYVTDQTNSMHTQIKDLADRVSRYESSGPVVHERPPAPPSPKFAGWRDPFSDPWAKFKGKESPHIAQSPERPWHGRQTSPPRSSASPSPARSPVPFEPKLVIVKGWCRYQDPKRSLTQEEARDVGAHLMELMGGNFGRLVIFQDPLLQNSRLVFRTHNSEDANIVKNMLTDRFNMKPYLIKQMPVFAMQEQSPERRERSAIIAKANGLLEDAVGSNDRPFGREGRQQLFRAELGRRQGPQDRREFQCCAEDVVVVG